MIALQTELKPTLKRLLAPHIPLENNYFKAGYGVDVNKSVILHRVSRKQYREEIVLASPCVVCPLRTPKLTRRVLHSIEKKRGRVKKKRRVR